MNANEVTLAGNADADYPDVDGYSRLLNHVMLTLMLIYVSKLFSCIVIYVVLYMINPCIIYREINICLPSYQAVHRVRT